MNKKKQTILLFFLFSFSAYCALIIGKSWDEGTDLLHGKSTLNYLFSLGKFDDYFVGREYYSAIYWSLQYLLTTIFPSKYQIEISHLVNLIFSLAAIIGISQLGKELFNKKVGKIIFLVLFFYPIFFGHMGMNPKDTILAFSHVWITLLTLKYLRKQHCEDKDYINNYIISIGVLAALSTGIQLFFLGSLIPIFLFVLLEIFFFKKIVNKKFNNKKFFYDLVKCFAVFYFLLIFFWIDTHPNILTLPLKFFMEALSNTYVTGWPFNLVNGNYYLSWQVPQLYILVNIFYKSPEYFLMTYIFFLFIIIKSSLFFDKKFIYFRYKLCLIIVILIFPILVSLIIPFPLYDGLRLFLWALPYFCIIPGLTIYYLVENLNFAWSKLASILLSLLIIYYLFNFFSYTPYQYTYLNIFSGKAENRYQKFENDYWGVSIYELLKYSDFDKEKTIKIATCGINSAQAKKYLRKKGYANLIFSDLKQADYIIMTNRTSLVSGELTAKSTNETVKIINCFDRFEGEDAFQLKRNGSLLSVIRKKTNISDWN